MSANHLAILLILISVSLIIAAIVRLRKKYINSRGKEHVKLSCQDLTISLLPVCGVAFLLISVLRGAGIFLSATLLNLVFLPGMALFISAILDFIGDYYFCIAKKNHSRKDFIKPCIIIFTGIGAVFFVLYLRSVPASEYGTLKMSIPFKSRWEVITGGRFAFMNYHNGNPDAQNYAVDFVISGSAGDSRGQELFSPVNGVVFEAFGSRKEGVFDPPEGNIIKIKTEDGIDVWLAHLEENSVKVKAGDRVEKMQLIARCGATGGADLPHLHLHAEKNGKAVPMLLGRKKNFPVKGDIINGQ
jgi:peptidase M23-like protein